MALPERRSLGAYPVIVPLGWALVDEEGRLVPLPNPPASIDPYHRIVAAGELLATEANDTSVHQPQVVMLQRFALAGPITLAVLDRYLELVVMQLAKQGIASETLSRTMTRSALSAEPCRKIVLKRNGPSDTRIEIHYVFDDHGRGFRDLVYLIRDAEQHPWHAIFAELEERI